MIKPFFILVSLFIVVDMISNEYGYFNTRINHIKTCQGPKRKDCCVNTVKLMNENVVAFNSSVKENVTPTKAKVVASFKGKQMIRLPVNKPCDHFFIKPIITSLYNVTEGCVILKGHYNFNLDMADIFMNYYKGMFLYGNWTFRSMFWGNDCNFICILTDINLYPKTEVKQD